MVANMREWAMSAPVFLYYLYRTGNIGLVLLACGLLLRNRSELLVRYGIQEPVSYLFNFCTLSRFVGTSFSVLLIFVSFHLYDSVSRSRCIPKWNGIAGPLLFPCGTAHTRMFPQKHSFKYSYIMVGIPVEWEGNAAGMISAGMESRPNFKKGLYNVDPGDYLEPGSREVGLRAKLDIYLRTQHVEPSNYPFAYLTTAAKFMGYSSNPVSFWFLYSADKTLSAMILEVNNTFDERRMYFLQMGGDNEPQNGQSNVADASRMKKTWPKDFHVSPFNSRKGSYSLAADDPFSGSTAAGKGPINATITLSSSKGHPKLVARVFSDGPPIDPTSMSTWQKLKFLMCWWWVGLATIPRTVKEAAVLFFSKKLHVWYRPEPLKTTIPRRASDEEQRAEQFFRVYLRHLVETTPIAVTVKYTASGLNDSFTCEDMCSPKAKDGGDEPPKVLEFKVLTPIFYTRFLHYAHNVEALCREHEMDGTIWLSDLSIVPELVMRPPRKVQLRGTDGFSIHLAQLMRRPPEPIERPLTSSATPTRPSSDVDIRKFRNSPMDAYFIEQEDDKMRKAYMVFVLRTLIQAQWFGGIWTLLELAVNSEVFMALVLSWLANPLFQAKVLS